MTILAHSKRYEPYYVLFALGLLKVVEPHRSKEAVSTSAVPNAQALLS